MIEMLTLNVPSGGSAGVPRSKRLKIAIACDPCRTKKIKCDGARPVCEKCARKFGKSDQCHYSAESVNRGGRPSLTGQAAGESSRITPNVNRDRVTSHKRPILPTPSPPSTAPLQSQAEFAVSPPNYDDRPASAKHVAGAPARGHHHSLYRGSGQERTGVDSMNAAVDGTSTEYFGSSSAGSFSRQIKAAIDERLGCSQTAITRNSQLQPLHSLSVAKRNNLDISNLVLPPRRLANALMQTYWDFIAPLYPFLDRRAWEESYNNIFAGQPINCDERVFIATMNMIFALSTQLEEHLDQEKREHSSNVYFERAREPLDTMLWSSGTFELIQYLLLAGQYLQCTISAHQTWMVVGSAARIALSLGLHLPETSATAPTPTQRELYRRIWHGCVLLDRMVSLTHGRPAMVSPDTVTSVPYPRYGMRANSLDTIDGLGDAGFFVKSAELYEITHELTVKLYPATAHSNKHPPGSSLEDLTTVLRLDDRLMEWESTIPEHLQAIPSEVPPHISPYREAVILRLRLLHARILLLRPTLALLCLPKSQQRHDAPDGGLRERIYQQCAEVCVDTARGTISLLSKYQASDGTVGLLPAWWYRLYYLFSASTVLIAAKLRPDIFESGEVDSSWETAMHVFQALKNVSLSAQKCVAALHILSSKILQTNQGEHTHQAGNSVLSITDQEQSLPQDFSWDADQTLDISHVSLQDFTFDAEDMSWLNYMTTWNVLGD